MVERMKGTPRRLSGPGRLDFAAPGVQPCEADRRQGDRHGDGLTEQAGADVGVADTAEDAFV